MEQQIKVKPAATEQPGKVLSGAGGAELGDPCLLAPPSFASVIQEQPHTGLGNADGPADSKEYGLASDPSLLLPPSFASVIQQQPHTGLGNADNPADSKKYGLDSDPAHLSPPSFASVIQQQPHTSLGNADGPADSKEYGLNSGMSPLSWAPYDGGFKPEADNSTSKILTTLVPLPYDGGFKPEADNSTSKILTTIPRQGSNDTSRCETCYDVAMCFICCMECCGAIAECFNT